MHISGCSTAVTFYCCYCSERPGVFNVFNVFNVCCGIYYLYRYFISYLIWDITFYAIVCELLESIYLPVYLSICLSVYLSRYLSVCLSVYPSISLSIYLSVCVCLSVCPSIYLSDFLPVYLSVSPCVCLSVCLSFHLSVCLSIYLSISISQVCPPGRFILSCESLFVFQIKSSLSAVHCRKRSRRANKSTPRGLAHYRPPVTHKLSPL